MLFPKSLRGVQSPTSVRSMVSSTFFYQVWLHARRERLLQSQMLCLYVDNGSLPRLFSNLFCQKSCVKLWELCLEAQNSAHGYAEAQRLQDLISNADAGVQKIGVAGMKALLNSMFGYGGNPRRPLLPFSDQGLENLLQNSWMKQLVKYESELGHGAE